MDGEVIEAGKPVTMVNLDPDAVERVITFTPTQVKQLLVPYILDGQLVIDLPSISQRREYVTPSADQRGMGERTAGGVPPQSTTST